MKVNFGSVYRIRLQENDLNGKKYQLFTEDTKTLRAKNAVTSFNPDLMFHYVNIRDSQDTLFEKLAEIYKYNVEKTCPSSMLNSKIVSTGKMKSWHEIDIMKAMKN